MKFSMIIGTLNRKNALVLCLNSLFQQTYVNYEIILIDQSDNNDTQDYINTLNDKRIIYKHVNFKGLSKARNAGLKLATGTHFCLIDDDAFYDKRYLENAKIYLQNSKIILSGFIYDTIRKTAFADYNDKFNGMVLNMRMIMRTCPSAALIFPMNVIYEIGGFDEQLGIGSAYGAAEESDMLIRCINFGYKIVYCKDNILYHPVPVSNKKNIITIEKISMYYSGLGALYKKHFLIRKNKKLRICYYELWVKLLIKILLPFKYNSENAIKCIKGFKYGIDNYNEDKI